ncbi:MAG: DNA polymerase [Candidatus Paceibacterota bacterium]
MRPDTCNKKCGRYALELEHPCIRGRGNKQAKVMFVGESPGQNEDNQGKCFVGRAGQLLIQEIKGVGIESKDVYLTNIVKCAFPKVNKKPSDAEAKHCKQYIEKEIEEIKPNLIVLLGDFACETLIGRGSIKKIQNNFFVYEPTNTKVIPLLHPAYVLRNPEEIVKFREGMQLIAQELHSPDMVYKSSIKENYLVADTEQKALKTLNKLMEVSAFSVDIETSGLDYRNSDILSIQFSWQPGVGITIPWNIVVESKVVYDLLKQVLSRKDAVKVGTNLKFDIQHLAKAKIAIAPPIHDIMLADSLIDENAIDHKLETMILRMTDMGEYWSELEKYKLQIMAEKKIKEEDFSYALLPKPVLYLYGAKDTDGTFRIYLQQLKELNRQGLTEFFERYSMPFMPVLAEMEYRGVKVDRDRAFVMLKEQEKLMEELSAKTLEDENVKKYEEFRSRKAKEELKEHRKKSKTLVSRFPDENVYVEERIKKMGDKWHDEYRFNPNSSAQMKELFFDMLGLVPVKMTKPKKGSNAKPQPSTDKDVMEVIAERDQISLAILMREYALVSKFVTNFMRPVYELSEFDGRIHTNYIQTDVVTGRLSSRSPNLQNMSRDRPEFKDLFVADDGMVFVKGDLAQAEFRVWANASDDEDMIRDIMSGLDIHRRTASEVFEIAEEEVTKKQREPAKRGTFGMMYGIGSKTLAQRFKITLDQAKKILKVFSERYPVATAWIYSLPKIAHSKKQVRSILGRIRHLPHIDSDDQDTVAKAERQAMNSPVQAAASDINNHYMTCAVREGRRAKIKCYPALTVHDENVSQVEESRAEDFARIYKKVVDTEFPQFKCKMGVEIKIGKRIGSAEEW